MTKTNLGVSQFKGGKASMDSSAVCRRERRKLAVLGERVRKLGPVNNPVQAQKFRAILLRDAAMPSFPGQKNVSRARVARLVSMFESLELPV